MPRPDGRPMTAADWAQEEVDRKLAAAAHAPHPPLFDPAERVEKAVGEIVARGVSATQVDRTAILKRMQHNPVTGEPLTEMLDGRLCRLGDVDLAADLAGQARTHAYPDTRAPLLRETTAAGVPREFAEPYASILTRDAETGDCWLQMPQLGIDGRHLPPRRGSLSELLPIATHEILRQWRLAERRKGLDAVIQELKASGNYGTGRF